MGIAKTPIDLDSLELPVRFSDRLVAVRSNDIKRHGFNAWRGHNSDQKICVPPTSGDFPTWVNQDTATITDVDDGCYLTRAPKGAGDSLHCRLRPLPAGSWDIVLGCICAYPMKAYHGGGMALRESASGKVLTWQFGHSDAGPTNVWWNSATAFQQGRYNPSTNGGSSVNIGWFRARKNGSNYEYLWSPDGTAWHLELVETTSSFWTSAPNQWGLFINSNNNTTPNLVTRCDFIDWRE